MKQINILQAYKAMCAFLEAHYQRTSQNEEIGSLLGGMPLLTENPIDTLDSSMWEDWIKAIKKVEHDTKK